MFGFITTRHLVTQGIDIVREFGVRCFLRCVWRTLTRRGAVTFLECVDSFDGG
jgi:hypothetical protein